MANSFWVPMGVLTAALLLGAAVSGSAGDYATVTGPCQLRFPEDHGAHPRHRTEWWYYTGNVRSTEGRRFGYQFTIFRYRLSSPGKQASWPDPASQWRTAQLFIGHGAVSDLNRKQHLQAELMSRGALGLAGVTEDKDGVRVYLNQWQARIGPEQHRIQASGDAFSLSLDHTPLKTPVSHGDKGYSRKGTAPGRASCYYSITRLDTAGIITVAGERHAVEGVSWMDHEYSMAPLEPGIRGWDWFSLQLSDNTELMFFLLRQKETGIHPASSGTFVDAAGKAHHLTFDALSVTVKQTWQSPESGSTYPVAWIIDIPPRRLQLSVTANLKNQEMRTSQTSNVNYWEGSVSITGAAGGSPVSGVGYVELTGYGKAFDAPM